MLRREEGRKQKHGKHGICFSHTEITEKVLFIEEGGICFSPLGRICNPTSLNIRIFNPRRHRPCFRFAFQMLIFSASELPIPMSKAANDAQQLPSLGEGLGVGSPPLGRICNPTSLNIRIFNPRRHRTCFRFAFQMLIFNASELQIPMSKAANNAQQLPSLGEGLGVGSPTSLNIRIFNPRRHRPCFRFAFQMLIFSASELPIPMSKVANNAQQLPSLGEGLGVGSPLTSSANDDLAGLSVLSADDVDVSGLRCGDGPSRQVVHRGAGCGGVGAGRQGHASHRTAFPFQHDFR